MQFIMKLTKPVNELLNLTLDTAHRAEIQHVAVRNDFALM